MNVERRRWKIRREPRSFQGEARPFRNLIARAFAVFAFSATFFGLLMLVVFFSKLGIDTWRWFETMPALIQERNEELLAGEREARDLQNLIQRELQEIDQFMEQELAAAASEEEKQEIRQDYERIKERKRADVEKTAQEKIATAEFVREDTSPPALLGHFLTEGPSNLPQDAGVGPALLGSIFLAAITIVCAVPVGVGAAVYLEEYRSTGRLARLIQVNINNLAGVPSVLYGILGAYVFVELIFKPIENEYPNIAARNVLGGGLTLALLTLPIVIVSSQEAIRAVPVSIRHAAMALGATHWQVIWHHVLPGAFPGILTGTILAMSRAIGEAAPLVLFGALLYVNQTPTLFSRFTVLPMQIFGWTDRPQDAWRYNASVASVVLILALLTLNAGAIYFRNRARRAQR